MPVCSGDHHVDGCAASAELEEAIIHLASILLPRTAAVLIVFADGSMGGGRARTLERMPHPACVTLRDLMVAGQTHDPRGDTLIEALEARLREVH